MYFYHLLISLSNAMLGIIHVIQGQKVGHPRTSLVYHTFLITILFCSCAYICYGNYYIVSFSVKSSKREMGHSNVIIQVTLPKGIFPNGGKCAEGL